jgi:hypothetical protein
MQHQQQAAANHIAQCAIGLLPLPRLAQLRRKSAPAGVGIVSDQLSNKGDVFLRNDSATIPVIERHLDSVWQSPKWNVSILYWIF